MIKNNITKQCLKIFQGKLLITIIFKKSIDHEKSMRIIISEYKQIGYESTVN